MNGLIVLYIFGVIGIFFFQLDSGGAKPIQVVGFIAVAWPLVLVIEIGKGAVAYFSGDEP